MSHFSNVDSIANPKQAGGEFKPSVQRDEPHHHGGHKPGVKASPYDSIPEFHAQTLPPGTAPASSSYVPHLTQEYGGQVPASETLGGATSADVNAGLGKPLQGQTKREIYHDGQHGRKHQGSGLEGVGASQPEKYERTIPSQRGYERDNAAAGQRGDKGAFAAEERNPEPAETAAHEWSYEPSTKRY